MQPGTATHRKEQPEIIISHGLGYTGRGNAGKLNEVFAGSDQIAANGNKYKYGTFTAGRWCKFTVFTDIGGKSLLVI